MALECSPVGHSVGAIPATPQRNRCIPSLHEHAANRKHNCARRKLKRARQICICTLDRDCVSKGENGAASPEERIIHVTTCGEALVKLPWVIHAHNGTLAPDNTTITAYEVINLQNG
jgi:hypothetical protein